MTPTPRRDGDEGSSSSQTETSQMDMIEDTLRSLRQSTLRMKDRNAEVIGTFARRSGGESLGWKGRGIDVGVPPPKPPRLQQPLRAKLQESSELQKRMSETLRMSAKIREDNQRYLDQLRSESLSLSRIPNASLELSRNYGSGLSSLRSNASSNVRVGTSSSTSTARSLLQKLTKKLKPKVKLPLGGSLIQHPVPTFCTPEETIPIPPNVSVDPLSHTEVEKTTPITTPLTLKLLSLEELKVVCAEPEVSSPTSSDSDNNSGYQTLEDNDCTVLSSASTIESVSGFEYHKCPLTIVNVSVSSDESLQREGGECSRSQIFTKNQQRSSIQSARNKYKVGRERIQEKEPVMLPPVVPPRKLRPPSPIPAEGQKSSSFIIALTTLSKFSEDEEEEPPSNLKVSKNHREPKMSDICPGVPVAQVTIDIKPWGPLRQEDTIVDTGPLYDLLKKDGTLEASTSRIYEDHVNDDINEQFAFLDDEDDLEDVRIEVTTDVDQLLETHDFSPSLFTSIVSTFVEEALETSSLNVPKPSASRPMVPPPPPPPPPPPTPPSMMASNSPITPIHAHWIHGTIFRNVKALDLRSFGADPGILEGIQNSLNGAAASTIGSKAKRPSLCPSSNLEQEEPRKLDSRVQQNLEIVARKLRGHNLSKLTDAIQTLDANGISPDILDSVSQMFSIWKKECDKYNSEEKERLSSHYKATIPLLFDIPRADEKLAAMNLMTCFDAQFECLEAKTVQLEKGVSSLETSKEKFTYLLEVALAIVKASLGENGSHLKGCKLDSLCRFARMKNYQDGKPLWCPIAQYLMIHMPDAVNFIANVDTLVNASVLPIPELTNQFEAMVRGLEDALLEARKIEDECSQEEDVKRLARIQKSMETMTACNDLLTQLKVRWCEASTVNLKQLTEYYGLSYKSEDPTLIFKTLVDIQNEISRAVSLIQKPMKGTVIPSPSSASAEAVRLRKKPGPSTNRNVRRNNIVSADISEGVDENDSCALVALLAEGEKEKAQKERKRKHRSK